MQGLSLHQHERIVVAAALSDALVVDGSLRQHAASALPGNDSKVCYIILVDAAAV